MVAMTKLDSSVSQLRSLVSQLAAAKGDLSNLTAPPFVLAPRSAVEIPACWAARQDLFLALASEPDPGRRALLVARNFACSLAGLVDLGSEYAGRKPLNPFLGELFLGTFLPGDGEEEDGTVYVAEQVSHHPPVTACATYNRRHGISTRGFAAQETSFSPASGVTVRQLGYAVITDHGHGGESHLMTLPTMQVRGIATGQLQPELRGRCWISSSSGYVTSVDLQGRSGLGFGGTDHGITAVVHEVDGMRPVYSITGRWHGEMSIDVAEGEDANQETFRFDDVAAAELTVAPIEEQTAWESRRAWAGVVRGIKEGDAAVVTKHKTAVEEEQRRRRQEEEAAGTTWTSLFFRNEQSDDAAAALLAQIPDGEKLFDPQRTGGCWDFVGPDEAEALMTRLK